MDYERVRNDFPALSEWTYLDTAFIGLYPRQVREGYDEFLDQWMHFNTSGKNTILNNWLDKTKKVRSLISSFIGAKAKEIAFTMSTGSGLNIVVNGIKWHRGDNVVFPEWEHNPLDTMTLRKNDVEIRPVGVKNGKIELSDFEKVIDNNTKLVQLSQVSYINGFRFNLKDIAEIVHEHDGKLLVDATQAVGAFKLDVKSEDVDYLSAAPYKYLMGPAGLAFLYINEENIEELTPDRIGWKNQIWKGEHAEEPLEKRETAEKFEYGTLHFQGIFGLEKSIEYINNLGIDIIERRNLHLSDYLWSQLNDLGMEMYTPFNTESTIVSFFHEDAIKLSSKLMTEKIKVTGRTAHGGHIRVSTHFYNSEKDIDNLINKLKDIPT